MGNQEAKQLLDKYLDGNSRPEEERLIKQAYHKEIHEDELDISEERYEEMKTQIWIGLKRDTRPSLTVRLWPKIVAAAVVLLVSGIGLYYFSTERLGIHGATSVSLYLNDLPAGTNKAILTLENGEEMNLSDAQSGIVIKGSGLIYTDGSVVKETHSLVAGMAAIHTPRGGQYRIELPDGTRVTLNAASRLKFPTSFTGQESRRVELSGEAYFEVSKDKKRPFIVQSGEQEVEVLGTQFNIHTYPDEGGTTTTLLEGSVRIHAGGTSSESRRLIPGEQANVRNDRIEVAQADMEKVLAWKKGDFVFNEDIRTIMRQISRWYDVEVVYQGEVTHKELVGTISRSKTIVEILKVLEATGQVHFKVEGRRVTVMP